eukprot:14340779-Heterocapsa_arctica.AAC.1
MLEGQLQLYNDDLQQHFFKLIKNQWTVEQLQTIMSGDSFSESAKAVWRSWVMIMVAHYNDLQVTPTLTFPGNTQAAPPA